MPAPLHAPARRPGPLPWPALVLGLCLCWSASGCGEAPTATDRGAPDADPAAADPGPRAADAAESPVGTVTRFVARRELDVGGFPSGLVARDLDGDGRADLAVAFERPGGLALWSSRRGGLAAEPLRVEGGGWVLGPRATVDGGRPTLVFVSRESRRLRWLGFDDGAPREHAVELGGAPRALGVGRLAPGAAPTAVVAVDERALVLWRPDRAPATVSVPSARATAVLVDPEDGAVWVASQTPRVLRRFAAADLAGERAEPTHQLELDGIPRALATTDVDGDGDRELVCVGGDEAVWILGLAGADGPAAWTRGSPERVRATGLVPLAVAAADLDADGRDELVGVQAYDTSYGVLGGHDAAAGRFRLRASEYAGQTPVDCAVADLDGDGRPDLAVANRDARRVSVLPGTGLARPGQAVFHEARRTPTGTNPLGLALGDLDGDGALDAVSANGSAGSLTVLFNRSGALEERRDLPIGPSPTAVRVIDADADGRADLVALVRPSEGARLVLRRGLGGGEFGPAESIDLGGDASRLETLDLAGDGAPDLVACDPLGGRVLVVALPLAEPAPAPEVLLVGPRPSALAGIPGPDGRDVLAVAHGGSEPTLSLHRVGPEGAVELARAPAEGAPVDLAAGRFPGGDDLRLALLARNAEGDPAGFLELWRVGPGVLAPAGRRSVGLSASEVVAGDVDGDGRDDLAVSAQNTHNVNLFLGVGGTLARRPDLGAGLGCLGLALGDLDGNGLPDLVVANAFSHDLSTVYVFSSP